MSTSKLAPSAWEPASTSRASCGSRHFGSWRRAKEALALSEVTTARRIEARFRYRRVGKVWRFTEDTLRETLASCVEHYGRPPMVSEFE